MEIGRLAKARERRVLGGDVCGWSDGESNVKQRVVEILCLKVNLEGRQQEYDPEFSGAVN